jgi:hypothetical protein
MFFDPGLIESLGLRQPPQQLRNPDSHPLNRLTLVPKVLIAKMVLGFIGAILHVSTSPAEKRLGQVNKNFMLAQTKSRVRIAKLSILTPLNLPLAGEEAM